MKKVSMALWFMSYFLSVFADVGKHELFQVTTHTKQPLDKRKKYVVGCDVNTSQTTVGLFQIVDDRPVLAIELKTDSRKIANFDDYFVKAFNFLSENYPVKISAGCIASPGNTVAAKNYIKHGHGNGYVLEIHGDQIKEQTDLQTLFVVNDFEVVGFGIQAVDQENVVPLHKAKHREKGTKLIVGAGGGLGTGLMVYNEKLENYEPSPISWSFVEFVPACEFELQYAQYLQKEAGSHSWGKVLGASGGILKLYDFLNTKRIYDTAPVKYNDYLEVFKNRAHDKRCQDAVQVYMHLYARLIRNVIYAQLPHNGVYITNTVAEQNPELFEDEKFIAEVFNTENNYLTDYLSGIPIYLVKQSGIRLYGAALYAMVYEKA